MIKHPNLTTDVSTRIRHFCGIKLNRSCMALSRLSKMMFIANSRKSNAFVIKKPIVSNSSSIENLSFEEENINYTNSNKHPQKAPFPIEVLKKKLIQMKIEFVPKKI